MDEHPPQLARRALLVGAAAGTLAACAPHDAQPSPPSPAPSVRPSGSARPPTAADWKQLARHVDGTLARPGSSTYDAVRLTQNPRYDGARPLAVLSVASAGDVATAFAFAQEHGVRVAIRSGGHSYPGWSAGDGALVVDVRPLADVVADRHDGHRRCRRLPRPGVRRAGHARARDPRRLLPDRRHRRTHPGRRGRRPDPGLRAHLRLGHRDGRRPRRRPLSRPAPMRSPTSSGRCAAVAAATSASSRRSRSRPSRHRRSPAPTSPGPSRPPPTWCPTGCRRSRRPTRGSGRRSSCWADRPTPPARPSSCRPRGPGASSAMDSALRPFLSGVPDPLDRLTQHRRLPRHDADLCRLLVDPGRPVPHRARRVARPRGVRGDVSHHRPLPTST